MSWVCIKQHLYIDFTSIFTVFFFTVVFYHDLYHFNKIQIYIALFGIKIISCLNLFNTVTKFDIKMHED